MKAIISLFIVVLCCVVPHCAFSQDPKAIDSLNRVLSHYDAKGITGDTIKVNTLAALAEAYLGTDPQKAMQYAKAQLAAAKKTNYKTGLADALDTQGNIYDNEGDYNHALPLFLQALKIYSETGDLSNTINVYNNIGVTYAKKGIHSEAIKYLLKGLGMAEKTNDVKGCVSTNNNIGLVFRKQNKFDEALRYYLKCLAIQLRHNGRYSISYTYLNIGEIYRNKLQPDTALKYYTLGLQYALREKDERSVANSYSSIGNSYIDSKTYGKALENHLTALEIRQKIHDGFGAFTSYVALGNIYHQIGDNKKALFYTHQAYELVKSQNALDMMAEVHRQFADIYADMGNYKLAYENHELYKQFNDSVFNSENEKKLTEQKLNFDFKNIQERKDLLAKAEIKSQRDMRNFILIIMSLIVIFLVIIIWQRNKIAIVKRQRALTEERNRISRDLHDNLGAQLSAARMFMVNLTDSKSENVPEIAGNSLSLLDASINDLRNVMDDIQDSVLAKKGYIAATEALINKVDKLNNIKFSLTYHRMDERPNAKIEHELYRITQELVNNTLKYANAKNVAIDFLRGDHSLMLMYEDDGVGFDLQTVAKGDGLRNIQTRVKSLGGTVNFDSMPNAGARTTIEILL